MAMRDLLLFLDVSMPYIVMTLIELLTAIFITLLQSLLTDVTISSTILVVYQQLMAAALLSAFAFFLDRSKRPPFSLHVLSWASFVGFLQIPITQLLLTASLRYTSATFQSVAMNVTPAVVFILAVFTGQEQFGFRSLNGLAKLLGIVASTAGATVMVGFSDRGFADAGNPGEPVRLIGCVMLGLSVLAIAVGLLLTERLTLKHPSDLTLSATINVLGTVQIGVIALVTERDLSSWRIKWSNNNLELLAILYGGIIILGLIYVARVWCIHKKGPLFGSAFTPLLILFSYVLQMLVYGSSAELGSIVAALLVIGGVYLLLWAKSRDYEARRICEKGSSHEILNKEPLLLNTP